MIWNPWHGCKKYSDGCKNCYVYRRDAEIGKISSIVERTGMFNLPLAREKNGEYKIKSSSIVYACMTSDFFIKEADVWREEAWEMIRERSDLNFFIITKRIKRFAEKLPLDWGDGYDNVTICCTAENQKEADDRLPFFIEAPIKRKRIICEPLLEAIDISKYLSDKIELVAAGGESGYGARLCRFDWILSLREQCEKNNVPFFFKQTGANFERDGKVYSIPRKYQMSQAKKAGLNLNYIFARDH